MCNERGPFPPEVLAAIYSHLSLKELAISFTVNKTIRNIAFNHIQHLVDRALCRYAANEDVDVLMEILTSIGAIITGSTVLSLLLGRRDWNPADLDIAIPRGKKRVSQFPITIYSKLTQKTYNR